MKVKLVHLVEIIYGGQGHVGDTSPLGCGPASECGATELGLPESINTGSDRGAYCNSLMRLWSSGYLSAFIADDNFSITKKKKSKN